MAHVTAIGAVGTVIDRAELCLAPIALVPVAVGPALVTGEDVARAIDASSIGVVEDTGVGVECTFAPAPIGLTLGAALTASVHAGSPNPWIDGWVAVVAILPGRKTIIIFVGDAGHTVAARTDVTWVLTDHIATGVVGKTGAVDAFGSRRAPARPTGPVVPVCVAGPAVLLASTRNRSTRTGEPMQDEWHEHHDENYRQESSKHLFDQLCPDLVLRSKPAR